MISVIMPTMWRSHRTVSLINSICASDHVDELIIIDNDVSARPKFDIDSKVVLLEQDQNIYVNPAWNLGVSKSKNDFLCIINDDISLDFDYGIPLVQEFLNTKGSVVGIHPASYNLSPGDITIGVMPGHHIGHGWGCCMFMMKDDWVPIPEKYKIWYGDNWVVNNLKNAYSLLKAVQTEMQTTSGSVELSDIINEDKKAWNEDCKHTSRNQGFIYL